MSAYSQQSRNLRNTWILIFLFVGLISGIFYIIGIVQGSYFWPVFGLILSLSQAIFAYYAGAGLALAIAGAKQIQYSDSPKLFELVQNLSKIAGIPVPRIYVSPDKSANAFATGRDPNHAHIVFNQGLLDMLDKSELEGVIAHELAHIANRDILIMTVVMVLASVVSFISDIGFRLMIFGGSKNRDQKVHPIMIGLYVLTIILAPIVAAMIQLAVSRQREFLADSTAVTLTRYPQGLINALTKLYNNPTPTSHYSTATSHFYIAPPKKKLSESVNNLFSTHPDIKDRISALQKM
jgi:heat shock protein HtpX